MMYAKLVNDSQGDRSFDAFGGLFDVFDDAGSLIASELTQRQVGDLAQQRGEQVEPHPEDIASGRVTRRVG